MNNTEMLANLRMKLDEASADFFTDVECYQALSNAQIILMGILPIDVLAKNVASTTTSTGTLSGTTWSVTRPNMVRMLSAIFNGYPCRMLQNDNTRIRASLNTYLLGGLTDPIVYEQDGKVVFEPKNPVSNTATITYIPTPSSIDASTSSVLVETTHPAIVQYALAELLKKQKLYPQSANEYGLFIEMLKVIR